MLHLEGVTITFRIYIVVSIDQDYGIRYQTYLKTLIKTTVDYDDTLQRVI